MKKMIIITIFLTVCNIAFSQKPGSDTSKLEYRKIYAYCLDGHITAALQLLNSYSDTGISAADAKFKTAFESRFKGTEDKTDFLENREPALLPLLKIYQSYWRRSLLDDSASYDSILIEEVSGYLKQNYQPAVNLVANTDSIDVYLTRFIKAQNFHSTGFGKTGKYYDLLIWKTERDTTYSFTLSNEHTVSRVILMNDFITLGWEAYATLDKYYPGGWSTKEALYCVQKAYDMSSEKFLISYLAHESRHFADFKLFPKLISADLEYRAKLTELSMAKKTVYDIIAFFSRNANQQSENGHSVANFYVIRDLSRALFKVDFEKDKTKWEKLSKKMINNTAYALLKKNTEALQKNAEDVESYIK